MEANSIPRVCVGMPVYNGERWIRESIESILSQTYPSFDLRISDNASTDGTRAICEEYAARDPRVRYFRNDHNVGVFRNYDLAFERSDADFFKWSAVGDICAPTFLSRCMEVLTKQPEVAELTLRGKVVQLPEALYFRRARPPTATARKTESELREFFSHEPVSTESLQIWKLESSLWRGVLRAPISWRDRARLCAYLTRRALWCRRALARELLDYWRQRLNGGVAPERQP